MLLLTDLRFETTHERGKLFFFTPTTCLSLRSTDSTKSIATAHAESRPREKANCAKFGYTLDVVKQLVRTPLRHLRRKAVLVLVLTRVARLFGNPCLVWKLFRDASKIFLSTWHPAARVTSV